MNETEMTLAQAIEKYESESGLLYKKPAKKHCKFERGAWLLFDKDETLVAIVGDEVVIHDYDISRIMIAAQG